MTYPLRTCLTLAALLPCAAPATAQTLEHDVVWGDRWNSSFHRFTDADGDGFALSPGEASILIGSDILDASTEAVFRVEDGWPVAYWISEYTDQLMRAVDSDGSGRIEPSEVTIFRDALGPDAWFQSLTLTDDGAVWWVGALLLFPGNGLWRGFDANGDGDVDDAGESVQLVLGLGTHFAENDLGTAEIDAWNIQALAPAGNGVIGYATGDDDAAYRFEDLNSDGDVTDPGESILFLNACGTRPDLPQQPEFANGTLPNLQVQAGWGAYLTNLGTNVEGGELVSYFATGTGYVSQASNKNQNGEYINFLIFRCVDGNGDRDVNDSGEVTLYYDGSVTSGAPHKLLILRSLAVADGVVYATDVKQFPVIAPGPPGNTWIHRFEDLNGDGDASDAGEQRLGVTELLAVATPEVFPVATLYTQYMADPWTLSVMPHAWFTPAFTVNQTACSSDGGSLPVTSGTGSGLAGSTFVFELDGALPNSPAFWTMGVSTSIWSGLPLPFDFGALGFPGCLLQHDLVATIGLATNGAGHAELPIVVPTAPALAGFQVPTQWFAIQVGPVLQAGDLGLLLIK